MSSLFESSAIVNKLDISLFMPVNRLTSSTNDQLFSQDFKSILQESMNRETQQSSVSNLQIDRTQEARSYAEQKKEVNAAESQQEYIEQSEQHQDTRVERSSVKEDQNMQTDDSNEQNTEENYAGQDTAAQDNVNQNDDASKSETEQVSEESIPSEQKNENESDETPSDLTVASAMVDVQEQTEELSDTETTQLTEELTEEISDELPSNETEESSGAFEETLSQLVESSTTDSQVAQEEQVVLDESTSTVTVTDTQSTDTQQIDQLVEDVSADVTTAEKVSDTENVQIEQTVKSATQDDTSVLKKVTEQVTESSDTNSENTTDSIEKLDNLPDETMDEASDDQLSEESSEDTGFRFQNMSQEKHVHQEKNSGGNQFEMNETTTQEQLQQVQSVEGQADALKDVTIEQIIQEKSQVTEGTQQITNSEVKKEVDIISGIDTAKGKETAESTQIKQEAVSRSQDYRADEQEIVRQVQARLNLRTMGDVNQSEIKFSLYPKQLGEVAMKLVMQDNTLIAKMKVDNESVKQVLESNMAELRKNLNNQGVKVEKIEVTVKSDTQTMGSFDDRRANSHAEQKNNYDYVTSGSHQFKKESADTAEQATQKTIFSQQQAVTSDGRLNYLA